MALEIERRFLVQGDAWRVGAVGERYRQGYLSVDPARTVRVRVVGDQAWLTLKSQISAASRHEFEYVIPRADADAMMDAMCPMVVDKIRYKIVYQGFTWEVDEFFGDNAGLVLAEIELPDEATVFETPAWIGTEVTQDGRFTNAYLSTHPYTRWPKE
ncbi:CYTH domain-containing protein [Crenobacter sp. SG2303]|uniref:CYTH domain-containing protein n=1 Tax=Crenobacter oryzisoli TaxID=3056844 RepID=A0ABT7XKP2_9NEIS|nr:CYTH domain-containing protein [Crenobacter sp. SG2303]MDN0074367.1 CYTH domain-containing protein [Crenobacter sp. SG2303]